jgi:hypothetical protein
MTFHSLLESLVRAMSCVAMMLLLVPGVDASKPPSMVFVLRRARAASSEKCSRCWPEFEQARAQRAGLCSPANCAIVDSLAHCEVACCVLSCPAKGCTAAHKWHPTVPLLAVSSFSLPRQHALSRNGSPRHRAAATLWSRACGQRAIDDFSSLRTPLQEIVGHQSFLVWWCSWTFAL